LRVWCANTYSAALVRLVLLEIDGEGFAVLWLLKKHGAQILLVVLGNMKILPSVLFSQMANSKESYEDIHPHIVT